MNDNTSMKNYATGGWNAHKILIILFAIYLSDYADRMVVSSMIGFIKSDWGISDAQAGWLISAVVLFITVFSIPASVLIDRWSRRKMVALMTFFWSIATLACAFTKSYTQLIIARAFVGIGEAGYAPGGSAMLAAAYPEKDRGRAIGVWNAAIPLGVGIGMIAGGQIAQHWGWRHAFGLVSLPGMLLAFLAWRMPDYKTIKSENTITGPTSHSQFFLQSLKIIKIPSLAFAYLGFAMNVSATTALMTWLPVYFERTGIAQPGKGGVVSSGLFALVLFGAPLGGFISDAWHRKNKRARMVFPAISSAIAALFLFSALISPDKNIKLALMAIFGIAVTCFIAPGAAVTQDVVHPGLRAFSYALNVIVQHILGDVWSPPLIGKLSDLIGIEKALIFTPVYLLLGAICFYIGSFFYKRDLELVEKVELVAE